MENIKCPICGATCKDIEAVKKCLNEHEKAEKDAEKAKNDKKIEALKAQNEKLFQAIKKNNEALENLGVMAKVSYYTYDKRTGKYQPPKTGSNITKPQRCKCEDKNKDEIWNNFEKLVREIFDVI